MPSQVPCRCTRDNRLEILERHLAQRRVPGDAGVVDEDVEASPGLDCAVDEVCDRSLVSDVAGDTARLLPDGCGCGGGAAGVEVCDRDPGAVDRERPGDGEPDALTRARHHGGASLQECGHPKYRTIDWTTAAGFSEPSISNVVSSVACTAPSRGVTTSTLVDARTLLPTRTGATKRTLSSP